MALTAKPISIRLDTEALAYMEEVLDNLKVSRNDFINQAVIEKLEDIYDVSIADQSYATWIENGKKTYSHEEAMRRYG